MRPTSTAAIAVAALLVGAVGRRSGTGARGDPIPDQHSRLLARRVLPSSTVRAGSPGPAPAAPPPNRANAAANGVVDQGRAMTPTSPPNRSRASPRWCPPVTTRGRP